MFAVPRSGLRNNVQFLIVIVLETPAYFCSAILLLFTANDDLLVAAARTSELICLTETARGMDA